MKDAHSLEDAQDSAALYALGALRGDEARSFEAHLAEGCSICRAEVGAFRVVADELGRAAAPRHAPPDVRARVLERLSPRRSLADTATIDEGGLWFVRPDGIGWQEGVSSEIHLKTLFQDPASGRMTLLVRMAPGATYPRHRHAEFEELHLLEGDLTVDGVDMSAGDYCRAEADTVHDGIATRNGCLFITSACERDERL